MEIKHEVIKCREYSNNHGDVLARITIEKRTNIYDSGKVDIAYSVDFDMFTRVGDGNLYSCQQSKREADRKFDELHLFVDNVISYYEFEDVA